MTDHDPAADPPGAAPAPGDPAALLEKNLAALAASSSKAVAAIRAAAPRPGLTLEAASDGAITGRIDARRLASARRPIEEGRRAGEHIDVTECGAVVITGFALGHHVEPIARRMRRAGLIIVFEPDAALLRAVFEQTDCAAWITASNILVVTDADDSASISAAIQGVEGIVSLGVGVLDHAPSARRLGESRARFHASFRQAMSAMRTAVVTTLVKSHTTFRNIVLNADHYLRGDGIEPLRDAALGRPGVVISAGPSLARNMRELARPGARDAAVLVATQTVLAPLLEAGIRPHFVVALDHHEISRRFYETLTPEEVEGITLVAEPKANPAILDAFPGALRTVGEPILDRLLGELTPTPMPGLERGATVAILDAFPGALRTVGEPILDRLLGELTPTPMPGLERGATVAHLAYFLARWLGCDPVALVGQDLAFTDGQYYAAGAAIHRVWGPELGPFNTLEMMEWERIARLGGTRRALRDDAGRPVYTDEQMNTYLVHFERMFAAAERRGLRTIDATEGGAAKAHTTPQTLSSFIDDALATAVLSIDELLPDPPPRAPKTFELPPDGAADLHALAFAHVAAVRQDVERIIEASAETIDALGRVRDAPNDSEANACVDRVHRLRDEVCSLQPAFRLVNQLNQHGAFNRLRADRAIELADHRDEREVQRLRIERDIVNVRSVADSARKLADVLRAGGEALAGAEKPTGDPTDTTAGIASDTVDAPPRRVGVVMLAHADRSTVGAPRAIDRATIAGVPAIRLTLARLASVPGVDHAVIGTDDPQRVRRAIGGGVDGLDVRIEPVDPRSLDDWARRVGAARAHHADSWRGGVGRLTAYDEAFSPSLTLELMNRAGIDVAVVASPDWALVDPALTRGVVERCLEDPTHHRLTFTQAAPGLAPVAIERSLVQELAGSSGSPLATIGGLLAYNPSAPGADLIARRVCVQIDPALRDARWRFSAETPGRREDIETVIRDAGFDPAGSAWIAMLGAAQCVRGWESPTDDALAPARVTLELPSEFGAAWIERAIASLGAARPDAVLTLGSPWAPGPESADALDEPTLPDLVRRARDAGFASVHVRTTALAPGDSVDALASARPDLVSIDLHAINAETYRRLAGRDGYPAALDNLVRLARSRDVPEGPWAAPSPWIVPRITRRDEVYEQIESFYAHWLNKLGAAVIDPLPPAAQATAGARIAPLPPPSGVRGAWAGRELIVLDDGRIVDRLAGTLAVANRESSLLDMWPKVRARALARVVGIEHADALVERAA